ncbi:OadG family protein [Carboxylicivirga marina]|uniref:OadG family protein n=1 Tax=Carboxylicivirga marina TaxID=2800988 RepID=A0ABS1HN46_9BACT|nr:OadG family protein [Carboxylicivirga marina]MBK3518698.1 OadG family protein [Carboxylicivirga marina]
MNLLLVDSMTWTITVLGWFIVFVALVFLIGVFLTVPKLLNWGIKRSLRKKNKSTEKVEQADDTVVITGETNAAIAMALHMYFNEQHDEESNVITIKEVKKRYSPWSSKVYNFNNVNFPR